MATTPPQVSISDAIRDFAADLRIDKSPKTIATYVEATSLFAKWAEVPNLADASDQLVRDWLLSLRAAGRSEGTLANRYNGLKAFFRWAVDEGLMKASPIEKLSPPKPQAKPVPVLQLGQLKAMLEACTGAEGVRDEAIIRLLADTGMRRAECAGLTLETIDLAQETAIVTGKGNRIRVCPFGPKTAKALRRYLRIRNAREDAHLPQLWLGRRGAISDNAILLILRRRAKQAGIGRVFVHQLRHTWAHEALRAGLQEGDVMRLGGWKDRDMLNRYGSSAAEERARSAYRPVSLGDRL